MNSILVIAAEDISSSPILLKRFRGKTAKELYRCSKGVLLTDSVAKPLGFAVAQILGELTKGMVSIAIGQIDESIIGYVSGIGFIRYLYQVVQLVKLKATARLAYNFACLPVTLYSKGIGGAFDLLQLSKLEKMWFGTPVYIFDDNRFWVEVNFTIKDVFEQIEDSSG